MHCGFYWKLQTIECILFILEHASDVYCLGMLVSTKIMVGGKIDNNFHNKQLYSFTNVIFHKCKSYLKVKIGFDSFI